MTLPTAGALTDPQLPTTTSNDARLGGVDSVAAHTHKSWLRRFPRKLIIMPSLILLKKLRFLSALIFLKMYTQSNTGISYSIQTWFFLDLIQLLLDILYYEFELVIHATIILQFIINNKDACIAATWKHEWEASGPTRVHRHILDPGEGFKGEDLSQKHWTTLNRLRTGVSRYCRTAVPQGCSTAGS